MEWNMEFRKLSLVIITAATVIASCKNGKKATHNNTDMATLDVSAANFTDGVTLTKVPCTLSDGTETECYKIVTNSTPSDHQMGPWCPEHITDDAEAGGIWLKDGEVYDVDGAFIENLSEFYGDSTWQMYDDEGNIFITKTEEDCNNAANPNVGEEYQNFCVECIPSYITEVTQSYLIPISPVLQDELTLFSRGHGGGGPGGPGGADRPDRPERPDNGDRPERPDGERGPRPDGERGPRGPGGPGNDQNSVPSTRGIALNGVEFSAPAPLNNILSAYTIAPFDDAGGHINVHQGYHYHTATGVSHSIDQKDDHSALIGYALDGIGIYGQLDKNGNAPTDLDEARGHYDAIRGYHYHVDAAGNNNFINGLKGAYAVD